MASHSAYEIAPDDEDDDLISTPASSLLPPALDKGKHRASSPDPSLSGRIGSAAPGSGSIGERTMVGGVGVETRCVAHTELTALTGAGTPARTRLTSPSL